MNVPGEDLPKVTHYYREPYPYVRQKVAIIGAQELGGQGGARLLPARRAGDDDRAIRRAVRQDQVLDQAGPREPDQGGQHQGPVQHRRSRRFAKRHAGRDRRRVRARSRTTGCSRRPAITPTTASSNSLGLEFRGRRVPHAGLSTRRRSRRRGPGVYIAGTVCGGYQTSRWFIENGRFHARQIARHIAGGRTERVQFEAIHWKTEE